MEVDNVPILNGGGSIETQILRFSVDLKAKVPGGANVETRTITDGDAMLWPANQDHKIWAEDEPLSAIIIDGPHERM